MLSLVCVSLVLMAAPAKPPTPTLAAAPKLAITQLTPANLVPGLCLYSYPVSSTSEQCRQYCDQAFGYYYSYVWMEAARCFETALQHDPNCAIAWLGLSRSLEKWQKTTPRKLQGFAALGGTALQAALPTAMTKPPHDFALEEAKRLLPNASHRESFLIHAKLHERGFLPEANADNRKKKAIAALDELLSIYEDDQEGWFARAQLAEGQHGPIPFYKALLKVNPVHPGAHHELVHIYENIRRPALGWQHAEGYIASSPKLPHAFHMQAHLAMRVGKWTRTTDWSKQAIEFQKAYHKLEGVKPDDDHQFRHHLETLARSYVHEGRFAEAHALKTECDGYKYHFNPEWFRMAVTCQDWAAADEIVKQLRKGDKANAAYFAAVLNLERGDSARAAAELDVIRNTTSTKKNDRKLELRIWEVQGRHECQNGNGEGGLKLLRRTIDKTKDDYSHHAWGGGAYFMEVWGIAALEAGNAADAEEAFQEALAHDAGCVRGALGLWALCDRVGRTDEANRYLKVAKKCWSRAEVRAFELVKDYLAAKATNIPTLDAQATARK
jgi:tetratricopeptide (TPR) repeat protein